MKKAIVVVGIAAALAVPTVAGAARQTQGHGGRSSSNASVPHSKASATGGRQGTSVKIKPSKSSPASSNSSVSTKPKAKASAGDRPRGKASGERAGSSLRARGNRTVGTPAVGVTVSRRDAASTSGRSGVGGLDATIPDATIPAAGSGF